MFRNNWSREVTNNNQSYLEKERKGNMVKKIRKNYIHSWEHVA